jgi:NADPH-dependent glutamate synthase beta subunit-like oxidoreductase/dihydroorotate dehydrogenase/Pyruvate/2-oxoacid:ferredoxin oxidoreductase delta subunit
MTARAPFLTAAQLRAELERCVYCERKPCREACPADCSPADFIMAARGGAAADFGRAAAMIMAANPLGGVCGAVCPDTHCMAACARSGIDRPIAIPAVQATIVQRARELGAMPPHQRVPSNGRRLAVLGGGPAGLAAAALLAGHGFTIDLFEAHDRLGGMARLVPPSRLERDVLEKDLDFVITLGDVRVRAGAVVAAPRNLLEDGYEAVVVAAGLDRPMELDVPGEELAVRGVDFLTNPAAYPTASKRVAVVGGGAVAADCASVAADAGAERVELLALEALHELPLSATEREALRQARVHVNGRIRITAVLGAGGFLAGIETIRVALPLGVPFHPRAVVDVEGTEQSRHDLDALIVAIGSRSSCLPQEGDGVFLAGDMTYGPGTVVEAVASGKNAAVRLLEWLGRDRGRGRGERGETPAHSGVREPGSAVRPPARPDERGPHPPGDLRRKVKSTAILSGYRALPVSLETEFFGRPISSPLLLSAAPPSDGYAQMRNAYEAGWAGGVMKTAFDGVPIHIPARLMVSFARDTYGNCDNVSGHPLDRVCREVERLRREFPDRLTMASTGGPVTGDDDADSAVWLANTRKLESAGACGVEYSLSCPQGGDGTRGDIVSQDAELTAKIIEWVLTGGDPDVPKLFKLTPAVTSIHPIALAVKGVFERHPHAKAGVTLANTFPTLAFRPRGRSAWDEGIVVGMSGAGIAPITYLILANVARWGLVVSANGGAMDYAAVAHMLALGARSVQVCSVIMEHGVGIVHDLHSGLSHLLRARGLASVTELVGRALPDVITPFEALSAVKPIATLDRQFCVQCGNCSRCPYLAVGLDDEGFPVTDPARCIGCSFCAQRCISGALSMRERTADELAALVEQ